MNLPKLFTAQEQSDEPRLVLGLLLTGSHLQALLIELRGQETKILQKSRMLEHADADSALKKADEAFQDLGPESESINQTIFCLESSWVKDGDIVETKRPLVKKITTELSLEALGFIVVTEALAHHFIQQNSLFSGLLFFFNVEQVHVSLISQGKIQGVEAVGRSDNSVADIEEALARFSAKHKGSSQSLPPKMMLASFDLNADELHKQQQQLLDYTWTDQNLFVQAPMIEVVLVDEFVALIAAEAARAVALAQGLPMPSVPKPGGVEADAKSETNVVPVTTASPEVSPVAAPASLTSDDVERAVDVAATAFGIPIAADKLPLSAKLQKAEEADFSNEFSEVAKIDDASKQTKKKGFSLLHHMTKPYTGRKKPAHFALFGLVAGVFALLGLAVFGVFFLTTAHVEVTLQRIPITKEITITVDPEAAESDPENKILAAQQATKTVEDESSLQTTGITLVGDKAKGKVTLINKTEGQKTFAAGTTLTASGKTFTLDTDVSVASASSHTSGITFGQSEGTVTATAIGEESNLANETAMTIDKFATDTFSAVTKEAFSGGASREVRVVAAKDRNELQTDLRKELLAKAADEFKAESGAGVYYIPNLAVVKETPSFSAKEGDEANELVLTLKLEVRALSYTAADLQPIAAMVLSSEVPDGYELSGDDPQILSAPEDDAENASSSAKFTTTTLVANISTDAFPIVQEDALAQEIVGMSIADAERLLAEKEVIVRAHIAIVPSVAQSLVKALPKDAKRITVILKRE